MIAVVDTPVERSLKIRPAAPTAMAGPFIEADVASGPDQMHRRRQTGQAAADNVGAPGHHRTP